MPKYLNTGTRPVSTGEGWCRPGEYWTTKLKIVNPNLTEQKPRKKPRKK